MSFLFFTSLKNSSHLFLEREREIQTRVCDNRGGFSDLFMEKIQGQNKLCSLNQKVIVRRSLEVQGSGEDQRFELEEEDQFLQKMQQSEDLSAAVLPFKDPNFLALLSLQTLEKPPWGLGNYLPHEVPELSHSPNYYYQNPSLERINEAMISTQEEIQLNPQRKRRNNNLVASSVSREKRKRKRTKPAKNTEEMESQRMTHITVERNRRRQMNVYLNSLRSLIPSSYILRGDQASIVGGAIDFVKILEQQLQSLEAQKITQQTDTKDVSLRACDEEQSSTKLRIDATVIESHVNLKIQCPKKQGQLLRSIIWLEKLRLTVLHLNVTSPCNASVSYSFNLKMEDDCVLGSTDEITAAVRQIFDC